MLTSFANCEATGEGQDAHMDGFEEKSYKPSFPPFSAPVLDMCCFTQK